MSIWRRCPGGYLHPQVIYPLEVMDLHRLACLQVGNGTSMAVDMNIVPISDQLPHRKDGRAHLHVVPCNPNLSAIDDAISLNCPKLLNHAATSGLGGRSGSVRITLLHLMAR